MYRIYLLLCILGTKAAKAYEASDEAKYIDLLPEEEKQEFLNRIARRILEEIQSNDTPDESNVEVSDAQLNAHDAYVQDLLKEESQKMRSGKSDAKDVDDIPTRRDNSEEPEIKLLGNDKSDQNDRQHVDLTMRANPSRQKRKNNDRKFDVNFEMTDSPSFNVIPVKVNDNKDNTYGVVPAAFKSRDSDIVNISVTGANNVNLSNENVPEKISLAHKNLDIESLVETTSHNTNNKRSIEVTQSTIAESSSSKNVDVNSNHDDSEQPFTVATNPKNHNTDTQYNITESVDETQTDNPNGNINKSKDFVIESISLIGNEKETVTSDDNVQATSKAKLDAEDVVTESGLLASKTPTNDTNNENGSRETSKNNGEQSKTSEPHNEDSTKTNDKDILSSVEKKRETVTGSIDASKDDTLLVLTTTSRPQAGSMLGSEEEDRFTNSKDVIEHDQKENIHKNKKEEATKNNGVSDDNNGKKYLRRLEIIKEDYSIDEKTYVKKLQIPEHKNINQHYVYEVSEEKPPFAPKYDIKEHEPTYYVPTYNFSPDNAYYNPYNKFALNTDEKEIGRNDINREDDDWHLRDGFILDFTNNKRNSNKLKVKYKHSKNNQIGNQEQMHSWTHDLPYSNVNDPELNIWRRKWSKYGVAKNAPTWPDSMDEDHPYTTIHKVQDHARAVKQLLYRKKKFGYMPSPYTIKGRPRQRKFGEENLDPEFRSKTPSRQKMKVKNPSKGIAIDYYFGRENSKEMDSSMEVSDEVNDTKAVTNDVEISRTKKITSRKYVKDEEVLTLDGKDDLVRKEELPKCDANCMLKRLLKASDKPVGPIKPMLNVLRDLIYRDDKDLASYNWLLTAAEIQASIQKLINTTDDFQKGNPIHPLDLGLLKYVVYLYFSSLSKKQELTSNSDAPNVKDDNINIINIKDNIRDRELDSLRKKKQMMPKNKKKKPGETIKHPIEMWQNWYKHYMRLLLIKKTEQKNANNLRKFRDFLEDLRDGLYDLHNAINHICIITPYNDQNWYKDLKTIFLKSANKKKLLQVLLHLETAKLFTLIEDSAKNGAEDDFIAFKKYNREVVRASQEEFVNVIRILEELKVLDGYYFGWFFAAF